MIEEKRYLRFMLKHKLTQAEFLLLYCIYKSKDATDKELLTLMQEYAKEFGVRKSSGGFSILTPENKQELVDRGYLVKLNDQDKFGSYKLGKIFLDNFVDSLQAIQELYEAYPGFGLIQGKQIPLKGGNLFENAKMYWQLTGGVIEKHKQIVEAVRRAKGQNMLMMNITNFINSMSWTDLIAMQQKTQPITTNTRDF